MIDQSKAMTPADWNALEKKLIDEHKRTLQMNQEIRQLALQGLYDPPLNTDYWQISPDGNLGESHCYLRVTESVGTWRFFPDEQTRTEYLQVAQGTWLPKKNDLVCALRLKDEYTLQDYARHDYGGNSDWAYFPSDEQRSAFIAKRKGEELRKEITEDTSVKEKVHEFVENFKRDHWPKPQTITICISDDAIERTIQALHGREIGAGEMQNLKRDAKIFVALLHTEYTLQNQA